jgi:CheY-like chemotaxis protein
MAVTVLNKSVRQSPRTTLYEKARFSSLLVEEKVRFSVKGIQRTGDVRSMSAILFVHDNEEILTIGKLFLEWSGTMTVDIVPSATTAIVKLSRRKYDAILSDYHMSGMNGIESLHRVRYKFGDIPFILFTGDDSQEIFTEALESGVDYCMVKNPEPKHQFITIGFILRHVIERKRTRDKQRKLQERENENRL